MAKIPEEIANLVNEIGTVCYEKQPDDVIMALWLTLLAAIMAAEGCSIPEAVEHARDHLDQTIAAHSPRQ